MSNLQLAAGTMVYRRPKVERDRIRWPWHLSPDERKADDQASRGEGLNIGHLDLVLEERTRRANAGVLGVHSSYFCWCRPVGEKR